MQELSEENFYEKKKNTKKKDYYFKQNLKVRFLYGILILALAIFWNLYFSNQLKYKEEFLNNAEKTTAQIIDIEYESEISKDKIEKVCIQYSVNHNIYTGILKEKSKNMYVGQEIYIFYNLEDPSDFVQNNKVTNNVFKYFGYFMLLSGIWMIIGFINKLILYISTLKSKEIKAKVKTVIEKSFLFYKKYIIECHWIDEKGEQYIFYSKVFNQPYFKREFEKMNINELPVRIKNKKKYIVITEKIDKKLMV